MRRRPMKLSVRLTLPDYPKALQTDLDDDQRRLYELIWKRTIASQMADARKWNGEPPTDIVSDDE